MGVCRTTRYEIQEFTLCDDWVNTWVIHHDDGTSEPETFATKAEAHAALDEFLTDIQQAVAAGDMACGYARSAFRIRVCGAAKPPM